MHPQTTQVAQIFKIHSPYPYGMWWASSQAFAISSNADWRKPYQSSSIPSCRMVCRNLWNAPDPWIAPRSSSRSVGVLLECANRSMMAHS